jgi:serine/threonine protein kinase
VTLYCTFQDYGTLYYQMEFLGGGDLWGLLQDDSFAGQRAPVGCHWSQAGPLFAEALDAVEHMHRLGLELGLSRTLALYIYMYMYSV